MSIRTNSWTITYDDGEEIKEATAGGKLSLDAAWAFIIDMDRPTSTIVLAVPQHRIIDIQENLD